MGKLESASFSGRRMTWIVGVAVVSFALALVLTAFADDLGQPASAGNDSFSVSAVGHHALVELLRQRGFDVTRRTTERAAALDPRTALLAAEPRLAASVTGDRPSRLLQLLDMARDKGAPLVVVLPKWVGQPDEGNPRWIGMASTLAGAHIRRIANSMGEGLELQLVRDRGVSQLLCEARWGDSLELELTRAQLLRPSEDLTPLVSCNERLLVARLRSAQADDGVFIVTDPDVLNNHGLGRADNARLMPELIRHGVGAEALVVDETIHGFVRNRGLLAELLRFPLVLAVVQSVVLLGVIVWAGTGRFGKPQPEPQTVGSGKDRLIDNTAKLIGVLGHSVELLPQYFQQTIREVAAHYFLPTDLPETRLVERLQEITSARGVDFDLEQVRRAVRSAAQGRFVERSLKLAQRLHRWREELTHAY